jgi:Sulfotransferase domain
LSIPHLVRELFSRRRILWPRVRTRRGSPPNRQVIVATAGRVGSTWTCNLLSGVGLKPGHRLLPGEFLEKNNTLIIDKAAVALLEVEPFLTWYKSHSPPPPDYVPAEHPTVRFVTILRDPRDMLVSAADYLAWLDAKMGGKGPAFAALPEADRILELIETGDWFLDSLERWQEWPHAIQLHYEDLTRDPKGSFSALLDACDLELRFDAVARAVRENDFAAKTGRRAGVESKGSFLRKGIVGDWRSKFDERCLERFATAKDRRWRRLAEAVARRRGGDAGLHSPAAEGPKA